MAGKDFFDLVKAIGESKSKQEEDRIITDEVWAMPFSAIAGAYAVLLQYRSFS